VSRYALYSKSEKIHDAFHLSIRLLEYIEDLIWGKMKINNFLIGETSQTYIIAEMSGNHCGELEYAKKIIRAAKEAGANAVKLQTYTADTITLNCDKEDFQIPSDNPWATKNTLYELYNEAHTPWEWHKELFAEAKEVKIDIFSSPFDHSALELLESLCAPAYKIASPEITDIPLIKAIALTKKPVILSTGVANKADIELALKTLKDNGCKDVVILKCTSSYPSPPETINLRTMVDFKESFNCLYGLSDHTLGIGIPVASVAMGASVIEKHFILERTDKSVDGFFSLDKKEFKQMVDEIRKVEKALGVVNYEIDDESKKNLWGRRSLYISDKVKKGETFSSKNVRSVRPHYGLHPKYFENILGKKATKDLELGDRLSWDCVHRYSDK